MRELTALSTGGGMMEVIEIDGSAVSMMGDFHETLIYTSTPDDILPYLEATIEADFINFRDGRTPFVEVKAQSFLPENILQELREKRGSDRHQATPSRTACFFQKKPESPFHHLCRNAGVQQRQRPGALAAGPALRKCPGQYFSGRSISAYGKTSSALCVIPSCWG
jgi:hypothetical protein